MFVGMLDTATVPLCPILFSSSLILSMPMEQCVSLLWPFRGNPIYISSLSRRQIADICLIFSSEK